jgi:hypothetical protein
LRGILGAVLVGMAPTDAVHLLCRVDQEKEQREGSRDGRGDFQRQIRDAHEQRVQIGRGGLAAAPPAASRTQILDRLKYRLTLQPLDHLTERQGKPTHVLLQGSIFGTNFRVVRGAHAMGFARAGEGRKPLDDVQCDSRTPQTVVFPECCRGCNFRFSGTGTGTGDVTVRAGR